MCSWSLILIFLLPTCDIQSGVPGCPWASWVWGNPASKAGESLGPRSPAVIPMYSLVGQRESQEALVLESWGHSQPKPNRPPQHQLQTCVPVTLGGALVPWRQRVSTRPVILQPTHPTGWLCPGGPSVCWAELGSNSSHFVVERGGQFMPRSREKLWGLV